jgi:hypothetical protein
MDFLPVRAGNLHDPAHFGVRMALIAANARLADEIA